MFHARTFAVARQWYGVMILQFPRTAHALPSRRLKQFGRDGPQVGSQTVTGDAGALLDFRDSFCGNLVFFPAKRGRFVHAKQRAKLFKAQAMGSSVASDCAVHPKSVAYNATTVNGAGARRANDDSAPIGIPLRMPQRKVASIHKGKTPQRVHYLDLWADLRGKKQADFAKEGLADKSTVSRWFSGQLPTEENLNKIADFLELEEPSWLFRDPADDWMRRMFEGRSAEERERMKATLEAAFPPKKSARS